MQAWKSGLAGLVLVACGDVVDNTPGPNDTEVTITLFRDVEHTTRDTTSAHLVAVQDGDDGAWHTIAGTDGVYTTPIANARFAYAIACRYDDFGWMRLAYRTLDDGADIADLGCDDSGPELVTVAGTVQNAPVDKRVRVGATRAASVPVANGVFTLPLRRGRHELVVTARTDIEGAPRTLVAVMRTPELDVQTDTSLAFDFATQGLPPQRFPITATVPPEQSPSIATTIHVPSGSLRLDTGSQGELAYTAMPAALVHDSDLTTVSLSLGDVESAMTVKALGPIALELPAPLVGEVDFIATPYIRPRATFVPTTAVLATQTYSLTVDSFDELTSDMREWFIAFTPSWVGAATLVEYTTPDLSALPELAPELLLRRGRQHTIEWRLKRAEASGAGDGTLERTARVRGFAGCGDGVVEDDEQCDDRFDSQSCDRDCTFRTCGDGYVNTTAGEECDPGDGTTCGFDCKLLPPT